MNNLPKTENLTVEFKTSFREDAAETLVAFSNAAGGTVYIGVTDKWIEYIITGEPRRTERFDYPLDAVREIVVNMVVHRDYRDSSASIIKIFDNRIEFYNPGKLYGGITVQDLLSGNYTSKSRNKLIATAFKEAEIIERYGSGIMRVRKICEEYGVKEPDFREAFDGFLVILYNERVATENDTESDTDSPTKGGIDTENATEGATDVTENATDATENDIDIKKLSEDQKRIIIEIKKNPTITSEELADIVGIRADSIRRNLYKFKSKGLIQRIGSDHGGHWEVISQKPS